MVNGQSIGVSEAFEAYEETEDFAHYMRHAKIHVIPEFTDADLEELEKLVG